MAQPFDDRRLELKEQAATVAQQVMDNGASGGGWGGFSASANGVLAFQKSTTLQGQLTWYDRAGKVLGTVGEVPRTVAEVLREHVTLYLEVEGIDRMHLNVYVPALQRAGGVASFFRFHPGTGLPPVC